MTSGEVGSAGPPDADALRSTDDLLDRLGRRAPRPTDLDDPAIATLAVLAGDVDLLPVPVALSRRALSAFGEWPPGTEESADVQQARRSAEPSGPAGQLDPAQLDSGQLDSGQLDVTRLDVGGSGADLVRRTSGIDLADDRPTALLLPRPSGVVSGRLPTGDDDADVRDPDWDRILTGSEEAASEDTGSPAPGSGGGRRRRSRPRRAGRPVRRPGPAPDPPQTLRLRPAIGVVTAAVLAVTGGTLAIVVGYEGLQPDNGVHSVMNHWTDDAPTGGSRTVLLNRLRSASDAVQHQDLVGAERTLHDVESYVVSLAEPDRDEVVIRLTAVREELRLARRAATAPPVRADGGGTPSDQGVSSSGRAGATPGGRAAGGP